jgi:Tfp pilus assembly protein PilF
MYVDRKCRVIARLGLVAAVNLLALADPKAAERDCEQYSVAPNQSCSSDPYERGTQHLGRGEYDLAIIALSEAIRSDPESSFAFVSRAGAYAAKGEDDLAVADFSVAISRGKDSLIIVYARRREDRP